MAKNQPEHRYSYQEYLTWDEGKRWELIDGIPFDMTAAPSRRHQEIVGALYREFANHLKGKTCKVYTAPFDVRLSTGGDNQSFDVVQPDVTVVCDSNKLDDAGCRGVPDLIIEVISPTTAKRDKTDKLYLYERYGVRHYWIVDPLNEFIEVYQLQPNNRYSTPIIFTNTGKFPVELFPELSIDLADVFA